MTKKIAEERKYTERQGNDPKTKYIVGSGGREAALIDRGDGRFDVELLLNGREVDRTSCSYRESDARNVAIIWAVGAIPQHDLKPSDKREALKNVSGFGVGRVRTCARDPVKGGPTPPIHPTF
jgi:hypothetical protein